MEKLKVLMKECDGLDVLRILKENFSVSEIGKMIGKPYISDTSQHENQIKLFLEIVFYEIKIEKAEEKLKNAKNLKKEADLKYKAISESSFVPNLEKEPEIYKNLRLGKLRIHEREILRGIFTEKDLTTVSCEQLMKEIEMFPRLKTLVLKKEQKVSDLKKIKDEIMQLAHRMTSDNDVLRIAGDLTEHEFYGKLAEKFEPDFLNQFSIYYEQAEAYHIQYD